MSYNTILNLWWNCSSIARIKYSFLFIISLSPWLTSLSISHPRLSSHLSLPSSLSLSLVEGSGFKSCSISFSLVEGGGMGWRRRRGLVDWRGLLSISAWVALYFGVDQWNDVGCSLSLTHTQSLHRWISVWKWVLGWWVAAAWV